MREYRRQYAVNNVERIRAKNKRWMDAHKEEMKQYQREWYKKNREKILARQKAKREEKVEEASDLSSSIADKEEVQPS